MAKEPIKIDRNSDYATRELAQLHVYLDMLSDKLDSRYLRVATNLLYILLNKEAQPIENCECYASESLAYGVRCTKHAEEYTGIHPGRFIEVQEKCPTHGVGHYVVHSWGFGFPLAVFKLEDSLSNAESVLHGLVTEEHCDNMIKLAPPRGDGDLDEMGVPPAKDELPN